MNSFFRVVGMAGMVGLLLTVASGCSESTAPAAPDIATTNFASSLNINLSEFTVTSGGMYVQDIEEGEGIEASAGQVVAVYYKGWLANGTMFDQRQAPQSPYSFTLGVSPVIDGFRLGVSGMQPGGVRRFILPPSLGYGATAYGSIPGNSILVFEIELVSIQ